MTVPRTSPISPRVRTASMLAGLAAALAVQSLLTGCSSQPDTTAIMVTPDRYPDAIAATREVLRSYRFQIDRVDASAGVVTTLPKSTSGLATPWDAEQSSFNQELEDLGNSQERRVRVTFDRPASAAPTDPSTSATDPDARWVHVEVVIDRVQRPGWRPSTKAVRQSTITLDPDLAARQMWPTYSVPIRQDPEFAREILGKIDRRLSESGARKAE